jgi:hypothetical protein
MGSWDHEISRYGDYSAFYWGLQAGARWFFTDFIGAFAEFGYGLSYVKAGVAFKF